jgi:hypothetical protein
MFRYLDQELVYGHNQEFYYWIKFRLQGWRYAVLATNEGFAKITM